MAAKKTDVIALFDVDGTLTKPRLEASQETLDFLKELRTKILVGAGVLDMFDYTFSENGLVAYKGKDLIAEVSLVDHLGEAKLQKLLNFVLAYVAKLDIPVKRGTFIEFRKGMLNVSPIGRNCSQQERCAFEEYDNKAGVRKAFVEVLQKEFADYKLRYSIGGQISFDVFPEGWDKTFALRYVEHIPTIHFFGDKTHPGGNDHEIFMSDRTVGHTVKDPAETMKICKELFF
ncbi:hypothetical protein I4F81_008956 [Pyropia yezoensis]|uniref:Uncharacterized protein n=1 Tax=Pyropia yezoensis TaxID=2788 RepID=A0ACC3C9L4_PYRYE|nr:hypothetical protein I4F81_008956 [Neopyropia yezoensis]